MIFTLILLTGLASAYDLGSETAIGGTEINQTGINQTGINQTGINQTGINQTGINQTGINQTGINQTGINQTEINQTEINQTEINQTEINQTTDNNTTSIEQEWFEAVPVAETPQNITDQETIPIWPAYKNPFKPGSDLSKFGKQQIRNYQ